MMKMLLLYVVAALVLPIATVADIYPVPAGTYEASIYLNIFRGPNTVAISGTGTIAISNPAVHSGEGGGDETFDVTSFSFACASVDIPGPISISAKTSQQSWGVCAWGQHGFVSSNLSLYCNAEVSGDALHANDIISFSSFSSNGFQSMYDAGAYSEFYYASENPWGYITSGNLTIGDRLVPEPSGMLALILGLVPLAIPIRRALRK